MGGSRLVVAVALMLVVSMATSAWASCMAEIGMKPEAQMACCQDGHDNCPMHGTAADCCAAEGQRQEQVSAAVHQAPRSLVNPPAVLPTPIPVPLEALVLRPWQTTFERDALKGPSPPPYLLGSAFLV
jgi:hypothetical protein